MLNLKTTLTTVFRLEQEQKDLVEKKEKELLEHLISQSSGGGKKKNHDSPSLSFYRNTSLYLVPKLKKIGFCHDLT